MNLNSAFIWLALFGGSYVGFVLILNTIKELYNLVSKLFKKTYTITIDKSDLESLRIAYGITQRELAWHNINKKYGIKPNTASVNMDTGVTTVRIK